MVGSGMGMPSQKFKQPATTVVEFFPGRFKQGAQSRDCCEFVAPTWGGDEVTGATFFDDTRCASGRSWCEGRWMQSRKPSQSCRPREASVRIADCKSFIDRAEKRLVKLDAERESEHALLEEGRAQLARLEANVAVSVPLPPSVSVAAMEAELVRLRAELADVCTPVPNSPIISGRILSQHSGRLHCGCERHGMEMSRGWRMSSLREQFSCVSGHNHPRQW